MRMYSLTFSEEPPFITYTVKAMQINLKAIHFLVLLLATKLSVAQSSLVQTISASVGISFPVGAFAKDVSGEGHGFADPGLAAEMFYNIGHDEKKLNYQIGIIAIINPLDGRGLTAMWSPTATIKAKRYNLIGVSGGVLLDLKKSEHFISQLRATLGIASISYPAHEMRESFGGTRSVLIYKSSADNSINLNGSLGLTASYKASSKVQVGCHLDFFRSRAHHVITFVQDAFPPMYEQDVKQQIASFNIKLGAYYKL
jgi:hypothetical protein